MWAFAFIRPSFAKPKIANHAASLRVALKENSVIQTEPTLRNQPLMTQADSPDAPHMILIEDLLVAHDLHIFRNRLGHQHPVKGIFMRARHKSGALAMFHGD